MLNFAVAPGHCTVKRIELSLNEYNIVSRDCPRPTKIGILRKMGTSWPVDHRGKSELS